MKRRPFALAVVSSLLMVVVAALPAAAEQKIVPEHLMQRASAAGSARVIVRLNTMFSPDAEMIGDAHAAVQRQDISSVRSAVKSRLVAHEHTILREYDALPFVALEAGPDALGALESMAGLVVSVEEDRIHRLQLAQSGHVVQAPMAWTTGFDGTGTIVAILDTGVQKTHPFLSGKVIAEACFSSNTTSSGLTVTSLCPGGVSSSTAAGSGLNCPAAVDGCDHGTHVAGIVAGGTTGVSGAGVAPGARIMSIQVFSRFPGAHPLCDTSTDCVLSFTSDQIAALNHVFNRRHAFPGRRIASINMSLGGGAFSEPCAGLEYQTPIAMLKTAGIATVIASGNDGFTDAMSAPACVPGAVSVGSTGDGSLGATLNALSWFSNSASFLSLLAPGQSINSSVPTTTSPTGFANFAGTSMATPHVAGAFAILRDANPTASVDALLQALQSTGQAVTDTRPPCPGCASSGEITPRISINSALNLVTRPDLSVTAATTVAAASPGQAVAVSNTVTNGPVAAGSFTVAFYLSTDGTFNTGDVLLGSRPVASLAAGGVSQATTTVTIPANTAPGIYRIVVRAAAGADLAEANEGNNVRATAPLVIGRDVSVTAAATAAAAMPGQAVVVDNTVKNTGSVEVESFLVRFYLSVNATFGTGDVLLGARTVGSLAAGALSRTTNSVTIPANTTPGTYRILVRADAGGALAEASESNNVRATAPILIGCSAGAITVGSTVNGALTTSDCRSPIRGSSFYADRYSFSGSAGQQVAVLLRSTAFDTYLHLVDPSAGVTANDDGGGGASATDSRIPATSGFMTLPATGTYIVEVTSFFGNATGAYTLTLSAGTACPVIALTVGSTVTRALATTDCRSEIDGNSFYADRYSFSGITGQQVAVLLRSTVFNTYLHLIHPNGTVTTNDDGGGGANGTDSRIPATSGVLTLPATGTYRVEVTSFNTNVTGAYTLTVSPTAAAARNAIAPRSGSKIRGGGSVAPEVAVTAATTVAVASPGQTIAVNYTVTNGDVALAAFKVGFYLSRNTTFDVNDVSLGARIVTSLAAGGVIRNASFPATIPANTEPGTYRILGRADSEGMLLEPNEANNVRATGAIVIGRPDLMVTAATAVTSLSGGRSIDVDNTVKNIGTGWAGSFAVRFYLSVDRAFGVGDVVLGSRTVSSLAAGALSRTTKTLTIPQGTAPGTYRILVRADAGGAIPEERETNNERATGAITIDP